VIGKRRTRDFWQNILGVVTQDALGDPFILKPDEKMKFVSDREMIKIKSILKSRRKYTPDKFKSIVEFKGNDSIFICEKSFGFLKKLNKREDNNFYKLIEDLYTSFLNLDEDLTESYNIRMLKDEWVNSYLLKYNDKLLILKYDEYNKHLNIYYYGNNL
jgi:hypothetical protein